MLWLFLFPAGLLVLFLCDRHLARLFYIRFLSLTKLLFSAIMPWGHGLNSAGSWVIGLLVVVTLCPRVYCYIVSITNGHLLNLWWIEIWIQKCLWAELDKWQKMLLSLRSNPQTMSPYIQDCDGLCTRTDHHMLLPIVLYMVVPLC